MPWVVLYGNIDNIIFKWISGGCEIWYSLEVPVILLFLRHYPSYRNGAGYLPGWKLSPIKLFICCRQLTLIFSRTPLFVQYFSLFWYIAFYTIMTRFHTNTVLGLNRCLYCEIVRAEYRQLITGKWSCQVSGNESAPGHDLCNGLPQAFKIVIPPMINRIYCLLKDSSLVPPSLYRNLCIAVIWYLQYMKPQVLVPPAVIYFVAYENYFRYR